MRHEEGMLWPDFLAEAAIKLRNAALKVYEGRSKASTLRTALRNFDDAWDLWHCKPKGTTHGKPSEREEAR